jgi:hypothetical protein
MTSINPTKLILGVLTPFVAAGSAWLTAAVGRYGVHLDPSGINALGVAGATVGAAAMLKLIHDLERNPTVERIFHSVEGAVIPVATAVQAADPKAGATVDDAVAQAKREVQAQFNELVAKLPQSPVAAAPAVQSAPAPVPPPAA